MLQSKQSFKAALMLCALTTTPFLSAQYASYYSGKNNARYAKGEYLVFNKQTVVPKGIHIENDAFIIENPGAYYVSFIVRAEPQAPAKATSVVLEVNGADIQGSQSTSSTGEISTLTSIVCIEITKPSSKVRLKNVTPANITVLDGKDQAFVIFSLT